MQWAYTLLKESNLDFPPDDLCILEVIDEANYMVSKIRRKMLLPLSLTLSLCLYLILWINGSKKFS